MRNRSASAIPSSAPPAHADERREETDPMPSSGIRLNLIVALVSLAITAAGQAAAQNYPSSTVKLIVPVPAGGVTDVMARMVGQRLAEMWGQSVIVDNRPG